MKELEEERAKMAANGGAGGAPSIVIQQPGQPPKQLTMEEVVELLRQQQLQIEYMTTEMQKMQSMMLSYQTRLIENMLA